MNRLPGVRAYAWEFEEKLQPWAESYRDELDAENVLPAKGAKIVTVRIVKEAELRKLLEERT